jgi:hypothetical protein
MIASIFYSLRSASIEADQLGRLRDILQESLLIASDGALITAATFADSSIERLLILICEALCFTNEDRKRPGLEAEFRKPFGLA